jgi:CheY-like chemotaxis protein
VRVLVVDDEIDVATYLASVLEDAGIQVDIAHDGEQALARIAESPPDLISLDLVMPRKSGIKVLMELRRNKAWSRIPVIIVTAHARDAEIRGDLDAALAESTMTGPSLYLEKPVTPRSYLESICSTLGVALPAEEPESPSAASLRAEAARLLESADAGTLEAIVGRLRRAGP